MREIRHVRGAQTRDLAQHMPPAVGEATADRGADGGDEAAAAGDDVNAGAHAAGAAREADEGAEAEGGGAREARAPARSTPRRESASFRISCASKPFRESDELRSVLLNICVEYFFRLKICVEIFSSENVCRNIFIINILSNIFLS